VTGRHLHDELRVALSTTYPEAALLAIARGAARRGQLANLYTTIRVTPWMERLADHAPLNRLRQPLRRELARRSLSELPAEALVTAATGADLLHRASRLLPGSGALAQGLEYKLKEQFDLAVARSLDRSVWDTLIAMSGSAEHSLRAARQLGRRTVVHLVNNHPIHRNRCLRELAQAPPGHHELVPKRVRVKLERELELADLVLVPSRAIARQLADSGVSSRDVVVQPYGVDPDLFHPRPTPRPSGSARPLRCLFVGTISHGKGVRFLLEAARRLQAWPISFLLIGPVRAPELLHDLPDNVEWAAGVLHDDVAEAMRRADLFVIPSVEDAYPLVTMEAMASGLPVIVSDHAGTSELITPGVDGLVVEAGNTHALVVAIQRLIDDAELRHAMGEAARRTIEAGGSWDAYGDRVLDQLQRYAERGEPSMQVVPA
jgi:glycosyltransferase involved in cell wall biosynthesis